MDVAVVTVGDELLSGETENTNASWLARRLRERGVTVRRIVVIPDETSAIADTVSEMASRYDAVVVTGGIGPTHDDVTMEGVAAGFDIDVEEHPSVVAYFDTQTEYEREDLVDGTAALPVGARMIPNDVGVAPGAVVANVYVLPGMPEEMRAMFDRIADEFSGTPVSTAVVRTDCPESALVDLLRDVMDRFDVRVGSYPGDHVTVKIHSTDRQAVDAAADWLEERL